MTPDNRSSEFSTRSDTNKAAQPQKIARGLKFRLFEVKELYCVAKTKALISCAVSAQLICVFVFTYMQNQAF